MSSLRLEGFLLLFISLGIFANQQRTICSSNDMEKMIDLDEKLNAMGKPIGNLRASGFSCTGALISKDLFLTARHCKASCSSMKVTFGYLTMGIKPDIVTHKQRSFDYIFMVGF